MGSIIKCCFTGHRPQSLPFGFNETDERCITLKNEIAKNIEKHIVEYGVNYFITGMAIGIDMFAAEIVLNLKEKYPEIQLEAAIPCIEQPDKWSTILQERYRSILSQCDKTTIVQLHYNKECFHIRNRYMVDSSDYIIAVWNGKPSGTMKTIQYGRKQGKEPTIIYF